MSAVLPSTYDKNVVDRRRKPRDADLSKTLRAARERLVSRNGLPPRFDRELLTQHAAALKGVALFMPVPIIATALAAASFVGPLPVVFWSLLTFFVYAVLVAVAHRFQTLPTEKVDPKRWRRLFLLAHLFAGSTWAYYASIECADCAGPSFQLLQFAVLLLMIALTAMISSTLKGVTLVAFLPLGVVLLRNAALAPDTVAAAMHGMLLGAIALFALIAERLRRIAVERLHHQAEKDELIAELETARVMSDEARHRAEEANLAKSRFLATMSHELRTPLNAILGFSEIIQHQILGPVGNPTYIEYVNDIHTSGQHLLDVINEILDLSRVEAGRYSLHEEAVDLVTIARDALSLIRIKAETKNIDVVQQFEMHLPLLWADERSIRQIILNLLSNAVKFTPSGGQILVRVGWTAGGGQYVSVKDNGPGIPEEELPIVLSAFGQGSIAIRGAEQGTGLGLSIVQALVQLHRGSFQLKSKLREGTEAIAVFPHSRVLEVMPAVGESYAR
ncbi:HAMP domain-containing histidine kinase [Aurantimonas sp. MSK8Z-1]|uniref:sensor histidine kinase n=1 Tax=Mangrovibrevibacter kandeliae TaxID=2968473 RepID=UPI00211925D4|nr:HAMP domain-containing sensor histidine kinase [Aurantimonas sp. MSK8Z-1]MCW4114048.1 HAMP domain-containing histidine kinase [Aurantimonas sp. MSK8Z-1]